LRLCRAGQAAAAMTAAAKFSYCKVLPAVEEGKIPYLRYSCRVPPLPLPTMAT
jgi:hypothetical protein